MATVLLVEDEETLRDSVARYLEFEGHQVIAAANGREAFDLGLAGTPDVLVADWMLRNHIHGLHVAQTLRVVDPMLTTVLITGFPSKDLEAEFESGGVREMLEKPFDLSDLSRAVSEASEQTERSPRASAAVFEVDANGAILFASGRARELLAETQTGAAASSFPDLVDSELHEVFQRALEDWIEVAPIGSGVAWMLRTRVRRGGRGWLVVVCREDEPHWLTDPRLRILLDHHSRSARLLPHLGPVVVLERDGAVRRLLASQVERIGALCYLADELSAALRLIEAEPSAATILIDIDTAGEELREWVLRIQHARPGVRIIGTGGAGTVDQLFSYGLSRILEKPWRIDELVAVLSD